MAQLVKYLLYKPKDPEPMFKTKQKTNQPNKTQNPNQKPKCGGVGVGSFWSR